MSDVFITVIATEAGARDKFITAMNHAKAMLDSGEQVQLTVGPAVEPVTVLQFRFFDGVVLRQISEQALVSVFDANGVDTGRRIRYVVKAWKRYFKERFIGFKYTTEQGFVKDKTTGDWRPAKKATPRKELISTKTLGPARMSKFIDEVIDHAVEELNVAFVFKPSDREGVRHVSKSRKPQND